MLNQVEKSNRSYKTIKKLSNNYDYNTELDIIKIVESKYKSINTLYLNYINTTVFTDFIKPINAVFIARRTHFVNEKMDDILKDMVSCYSKYSQLSLDFTSGIANPP